MMNPRIASYADILSVLGFGRRGAHPGRCTSSDGMRRTMGQCRCGRVLYSIPTGMGEEADRASPQCRCCGNRDVSTCLRLPRHVFDVLGARPKAYRNGNQTRLFCDRCGTTVAVIDGTREPSLRVCNATLDPEPLR